MSNALIMPQSIGSIIGSILTSAFNLGVLARKIENAPAHIQRLGTEAEVCKTIVLTIKALLYQIEIDGVNKDAQELIYVSTLAKTLFGCQEVLDSLEQEVEGVMKENMRIGNDDRARWVWREQEINKQLKSLEAHKLALNIALNVLNIHQGRELRKQNREIREQNAQILNYITGMTSNNTTTGNLVIPQATIPPTGTQRRSLTFGTISEVESVGDTEPASNVESPIISAELNNIYENSTVPPNTPDFIETSDNDYFETILLASRVYQKRESNSKSPLLHSNITWSQLHQSGASIFSYQSRSSLSIAVALVKTRTRAPIAILTKNRTRLNEALFEATRKKDITAMSIFLNYGADINAVKNARSKQTPLHLAVLGENIDVVRFLLIHGANIESADSQNETALFNAAKAGNLEVVKTLLEAGADPKKKNILGQTVLHVAAWREGDEVVRYFLECGADIESADYKNETALFDAARAGNLEVVKTLLEFGADQKKKNTLGQTVLHVAARWSGNEVVVRYLLQCGADIEFADIDNETALFQAVRAGNLEAVKTLLEFGAVRGKKNTSGQTALDVVTRGVNYRREICDMLREVDKDSNS